jgi:hypothetical protein
MIDHLTGAGWFSGDGTRILQFNLDGYLGEEQSHGLCLLFPGVGTVNFHWFMSIAGICADADADGDGKLDAWNFLGYVEAKDETGLFAEGLHPIVSDVESCPLDDTPCEP